MFVNTALSGTYLDGYRDGFAAAAGTEDDDEETQRRIEAHEEFLGTEGADHLFEGKGE
jgi:hypothetical protein